MTSVFQAWCSGKTLRKHTMHSLHRENVAEHTWGVILLAIRYAPSLCSAQLLMALHLHDAGESATGDIPAHVCWEFPDMKAACEAKEQAHIAQVIGPRAQEHLSQLELDETDGFLVEIFDRADFILSCLYEHKLGNRMVAVPIQRGMARILEVESGMPEETDRQRSARWSVRYLTADLRAQLEEEGVRYG